MTGCRGVEKAAEASQSLAEPFSPQLIPEEEGLPLSLSLRLQTTASMSVLVQPLSHSVRAISPSCSCTPGTT